MRILKIILTEHLENLNENKLSLDLAISGELKITKKMVVDGLHLIGQTRISKILDKKQGNVSNSYPEVDLVKIRYEASAYIPIIVKLVLISHNNLNVDQYRHKIISVPI